MPQNPSSSKAQQVLWGHYHLGWSRPKEVCAVDSYPRSLHFASLAIIRQQIEIAAGFIPTPTDEAESEADGERRSWKMCCFSLKSVVGLSVEKEERFHRSLKVLLPTDSRILISQHIPNLQLRLRSILYRDQLRNGP